MCDRINKASKVVPTTDNQTALIIIREAITAESQTKKEGTVLDYGKMAIELHAKHKGKIGVYSKIPLESDLDLSLAYTPGVAAVCMEIAGDKS